MAFLPQDEQNQNAPQGQTTNNPQNGGAGLPPQGAGGSVGAATGGAKAGSSPATGTSTQFGSSASKLGDYLSANAPQIQNQANNIVGGLNNQYGQVNQDITNAANQFQSQVQGGYAASNPDVVNQAKNDVTGFAKDPNNVKAFQSQYNNAYTGPQNFEGTDQYGNIQNEVNSAVQNANLLQSPAGLQSYLAGTQKNPTRASTTLDQLLLNGNPQAQASIQGAAKQFGGLTDQFGNVTSQADQSVQAAQQAAQQSNQYAHQQIQPVASNFNTGLQTAAQQAEAQRNAYNNSLNQFYGQATPIGQNINNYLAQMYGQPSIENQSSDFINKNPLITNPITTAQSATPEQYQQAAALSQLLGQDYTSPLDQANIGQAGTAPKLGKAPTVQDLLAAYQPEINSAKSQVYKNLNRAIQNSTNYGGSTLQQQFNNTNKAGLDLANYLKSLQ